MFFITSGAWLFALVLFVIVNVGVAGSIVFYESLLPHIAGEDELDRVSTAGYALGYLGGGVLLAINIAMMTWPSGSCCPDREVAVRASLASVAVWWVLFSIPLFRQVPEPPQRHMRGRSTDRWRQRQAAGRRHCASCGNTGRPSCCCSPSCSTTTGSRRSSGWRRSYGTEIGLDENAMIGALLLTQFVGVPFGFAFGMLAGRIGAKPAVFLGLTVYAVITVLGYFMRTSTHFFALALMVGMVQGGTQALSRSLFASMIPKQKSSEFFAFFGVFERYAGILGPALFAWVVGQTGTSRNAILSIIAFFIVGGVLLTFVNVEKGRREAKLSSAESS